jgi:hypothetical protein
MLRLIKAGLIAALVSVVLFFHVVAYLAKQEK